MSPRDHRIHLGRRDSPADPPQNDFITKVCFSGPQNCPKNVPGPKCQPGGPKIANCFDVSKLRQKVYPATISDELRITPPSKLQTDPRGETHFWGQRHAFLEQKPTFWKQNHAFLEQIQAFLEQIQAFLEQNNAFLGQSIKTWGKVYRLGCKV